MLHDMSLRHCVKSVALCLSVAGDMEWRSFRVDSMAEIYKGESMHMKSIKLKYTGRVEAKGEGMGSLELRRVPGRQGSGEVEV